MKALHDLFAGPILINDSEQAILARIMAEVLDGKMPQYFLESKLQEKTTYALQGSSKNQKLVIPIAGILLPDDIKYEGITYQYGTKTIATWLRQAYADTSITEIEIQFDSPGGSTAAVDPVLKALSERNKPVKTVVRGVLGSAAYWIASQTDRITLTNRFNRVGSIGVMATVIDSSKRLESLGIKMHNIYATQSTEKNRDSEEVLKGNYKPFQQSTLDPVADAFLKDVKASRPSIKEESLKGGVYYAAQAIERGLADELIEDSENSDTTTQSQNTNASMKSLTIRLYAALAKLKSDASPTNTDGTEKTDEQLFAELQDQIKIQDTNAVALNTEIARLKVFETNANQLTTDLANEKTDHATTKATLQEKEDEITTLNAKLAESPARPPITPTNSDKNKEVVTLAVSDDDEKIMAKMAHNLTADGFL